MNGETILFSGDIILGAPSTSLVNLYEYMKSLYRLRSEKFTHICLPHSVDMSVNSIIVDGRPKLE
jgi:hypothetical protein